MGGRETVTYLVIGQEVVNMVVGVSTMEFQLVEGRRGHQDEYHGIRTRNKGPYTY